MKKESIARNTMFLYIRMIFLLFISFYGTRILLKTLGIEDYGIYNIVGSTVALFSSIKGMMTSSTQRFLNYEMGLENNNRLSAVYSMSIEIHIVLSLVFVLVAELFGLWYINTKLVVDPNRLYAVYWVFHLSVAATVVSIMGVPFNALIIAHEKMNFYAYISILEGILRIIAILLLSVIPFDKLIVYAIFIFFIMLIIRLISYLYCKIRFKECKFSVCKDKELFSRMGSFAGWQFLGNSSYGAVNEGLNIMLNLFFGPILNASRGIVMQIYGAVMSFISNLMVAFNPRMTHHFARNEKNNIHKLFYSASKFSLLFIMLITIPFFIDSSYILGVWLREVPLYTESFLKLILVYAIIRSLHAPIDSLFKAYGDIRNYQVIDSIILLLNLPLVYYLFSQGYSPPTMFLVMIIIELINIISISLLCIKKLKINLKEYYLELFKPIFPAVIIEVLIFTSHTYFIPSENNFIIHLIYNGVYIALFFIGIFVFSLNDKEKGFLRKKSLSFINRKK